MRTVALISGGKDSCFNILQCIAAGHQIVALANLHPPISCNQSKNPTLDEMDSYMYQTVGHDAIDFYSEATGLPLYREAIRGTSLQKGSDYTHENHDDEVEDLYRLLSHVKEIEAIEAVSVGAILSNYQRVRVENVCNRLDLTSLSYLWQRDQEELLEEMILSGMNSILIKVASLGLDPKKHLGKSLQDCQHELLELKSKFGLNVCGEGGEYETLTLDCPFFKKTIVVIESKTIPHSKDPFAPVAYLTFPKLSLADKDSTVPINVEPIKKPEDFCRSELDSLDNWDFDGTSQEISSRHVLEKADVVSFSGSSKTKSGIIFIGGIIANSEVDLENMMNTLRDFTKNHGSSMKAHLFVCLYIRDMADYPQINNIYSQYFDLNPPTRVCVQAPIKCYAMIEAVATLPVHRKRSMHVQSISHWAPANIGPYSQCVEIEDIFMVSGQIGLIPGSMTLPSPANFVAECRLALRHAARILSAMNTEISLNHAIQVVCFVRNEIHIAAAQATWRKYGGKVDHPIAYIVVCNLPRNALIEWQIWAHRAQGSTEKLAAIVSPSKQVGYVYVTKFQQATALMCQLLDVPTNTNEWTTLYQRFAQHLGENHALRIYYKIDQKKGYSWEMLRDIIPQSVALTLIPVCGFESGQAAIVCGIHF